MAAYELAWMSATDIAALVQKKVISPVEVISDVLALIGATDERINAFSQFLPEVALDQAKSAEQAVMAGSPLGPLHGVPVTIKDVSPMAGLPIRFGSAAQHSVVAEVTAPMTSRLMEAGGIVFGRTTTPEFGWSGVSQSPLTGATHNPWCPGYNAGGSSSGAAAAAAAGFGPLHQGTDGAGSIRMPAHFCGVFGMKPSYGRVPYYPVSLGDMTAHVGPITRTVADAALMLKAMAGAHPWDHTSLEGAPADYVGRLREPTRGLRAALSLDLGHARVDEEVAALVRSAANDLTHAMEAELHEVVPTWGELGPRLGRFFWSANLSYLAPLLSEWEARMDPGLVACIRQGKEYTITEYQIMRAQKHKYITMINQFFEDFDLLLTPTASVPAFPLPDLQPPDWPRHPWDWLSWAEFLYPFNMSGNPAASIPCGFTRSGLPVGLQIVGRRFDDLGVLQACAVLERVRPWNQARPSGQLGGHTCNDEPPQPPEAVLA